MKFNPQTQTKSQIFSHNFPYTTPLTCARVETYKGIPRSKIPWYPIIDYEKCVNCGKCVDYCKLGAFEIEEADGKERIVVKNPCNCVVFCTGCEPQCPSGAIAHPSKEETRKIIARMQKTKSA